MDGEKRKDHRKHLRYPAKIDIGDGQPPRPCLLSNVSASGARILLETSDELPDHFALLLAAEHGALRRCRVIWREGNQIGVSFLKMRAAKNAPIPRFAAFRD